MSTVMRVTKLFSYGGLLGIGLFFSSCFGARAVKNYEKALVNKPYDAIIVPGVPFEEEEGSWSDIMKMRVYWSKYLYDQGIAKNIIYSGSSVYTAYVEAKIMALYAEQLGIPKTNIFTEERAEHSTENIYYSYKIAQKKGFENIALATDPYQGVFLKPFVKKKKIPVEFLLIQFDILRKMSKPDVPIEPNSAKVDSFVSITEREGFFKRFQGTMGKFIEYEEEDLSKRQKKKKERQAKKKKNIVP